MSNEFIGIVTPVSQQILYRNTINQGDSFFTISVGTCCNKNSKRHTIRIHDQVYFCVKPPFVRSMSWFLPTAHAA